MKWTDLVNVTGNIWKKKSLSSKYLHKMSPQWNVYEIQWHTGAFRITLHFMCTDQCLTFNVWLSDIADAARTPQWPGVRYIRRSACATFFSADDVCFSWKPKQTHWGPTGRPGILQEQLRHLWRSFFRDYLCPDLTFVYQLKEVSGKIKLTIVLMVKRRICFTEGFS